MLQWWYEIKFTHNLLDSLLAPANENHSRLEGPLFSILEESYMLSGMSPKPTNAALVDAWVKAGGEVTKIKARKVRMHSLRSKSHQMGGRYSRYNVGGNAKVAASRKSS